MKIKCNNIWLLKLCVSNKWVIIMIIIKFINIFLLFFFLEGYEDLDLENMDEE